MCLIRSCRVHQPFEWDVARRRYGHYSSNRGVDLCVLFSHAESIHLEILSGKSARRRLGDVCGYRVDPCALLAHAESTHLKIMSRE